MKKILLLSFILVSCNNANLAKVNPIDSYFNLDSDKNHESVVQEYIQLLNRERVSLGLLPLTYAVEIEKEADSHSADMAQGIVPFGYEGKEARCDNLKMDFPRSELCEEVVAKGSGSASAVLNSWLKSDHHKTILLDARFTHTGISFTRDAEGATYWTQVLLEVVP